MRFLILLLSTLFCQQVFGQLITVTSQTLSIFDSTTLIIDLDSTDVKVVRWDGANILVNTQIAFDEKDTPIINEILRDDDFHLVSRQESTKTLLIESSTIDHHFSDKSDKPTLGIFYTLYLPKSISDLEWIVNIPESIF